MEINPSTLGACGSTTHATKMPSKSNHKPSKRKGKKSNSYLTTEKPDIVCIASHAYRRRQGDQKELKYATSFMKTEDYLESIRAEVDAAVFQDSIANNTTPLYVFEEITGIYHTPEHPLINKGLLAPTKNEQYRGTNGFAEKAWPSSKPKPNSANRSFYRPNSTHNYLTKTITLGGSHDGFNPKLGTPTRAQLLRNRVRFSSAPDLTYSYLAQKRADGKHEAVYLKNKVEEEALQLKASKIEMDRTAAKFRKFIIGSQYNTSKWIETHVNVVHDHIAVRSRPVSSLPTRTISPPHTMPKRRAASAAANQRHLRKDSERQSERTAEKAEAKDESCIASKHQSFPMPKRLRKRDCSLNAAAMSRSANLVPYTTPINTPARCDPLDPSMIIRSMQDVHETIKSQRLNKKLGEARRLNTRIDASARHNVNQEADVRSRTSTAQGADNSGLFFVTNPAAEISPTSDSPPMQMNSKVGFHFNLQTNDNSGLVEVIGVNPIHKENDEMLGSDGMSDDGKDDMNKDAGEGNLQVTASRTQSVSVELPGIENTSDTLSQSLDEEEISKPDLHPSQSEELSKGVEDEKPTVSETNIDNYSIAEVDNSTSNVKAIGSVGDGDATEIAVDVHDVNLGRSEEEVVIETSIEKEAVIESETP